MLFLRFFQLHRNEDELEIAKEVIGSDRRQQEKFELKKRIHFQTKIIVMFIVFILYWVFWYFAPRVDYRPPTQIIQITNSK